MEYFNPDNVIPQTEFAKNPFWSGYQAAEKRQMMTPFMENAKQREALELQKKQQETMEFMSPEARDARMSKFGATAAKNQFDAAEARQKLELLPHDRKLKIAETKQKIDQIEAAPVKEMIKELGASAQSIRRLPEQHRPMAYQQLLQRLKMQNPSMQIPPQFQQYSPQLMQELENIEYSLVYTPEHQRTMEGKQFDADAAMDRTREQGRTSRAVAAMNNAGAMERTQVTAREGRPVNIPQRIVQINKEMPNATPERQAELRIELNKYIISEIYDMESKSRRIQNASLYEHSPGEMGEKARKTIEEERRRIRNEVYSLYGLREDRPAPAPAGGQGTAQIQQALSAAGEQYQPDKFEYKIGPNGTVLKRPKQ